MPLILRVARIAGFATLCAGLGVTAHADTFGGAHYERSTDTLVVTMHYRGTNPNHGFTLRWGRCRAPEADRPRASIAADVLDDQATDVEKQDYSVTARLSLADMPCRPARVTLRTAPRFFTVVWVPSAPAGSGGRR